MAAWILLMLVGGYLVVTVPDDLRKPFVVPTPAAISLAVVDAASQPEACARIYTIQEGDTLATIAQKTGLSEYAIVYANPPAQIALPVGNTLCLPDPATVPTPAPVLQNQWTQSRWDTNGTARLPATGFGPPRRTRLPQAPPAQKPSTRLGLYLPVVNR